MKSYMRVIVLVGLSGLFSGESSQLSSVVTNGKEIRDFLRLNHGDYNELDFSNVKIAILGYRYGSLTTTPDLVNRYLPADTIVEIGNSSNSSQNEADATDDEDRRLAQVIWSMTNFSDLKKSPKFMLLNARGPKNFNLAVKKAKDWGADVVLNTVLIPGYGNMDASGPITSRLQTLAANNTLWVQSLGRYNGRVVVRKTECTELLNYAVLPANQREFKALTSGQKVKVTLSWNQWGTRGSISGTDKDLDLFITEVDRTDVKNPKHIAGTELLSNREQVKESVVPKPGPNQTFLPLEEISFSPKKGASYYISVECASNNFNSASDRMQLVIESDKPASVDETGIEKDVLEFAPLDSFVLHNGNPIKSIHGPGVLVPADLEARYGITVSDASKLATRSVGNYTFSGRATNQRPDVFIEPLTVEFSDLGGGIRGPDVSAALFAGVSAHFKVKNPQIDNLTVHDLIADNQSNLIDHLLAPSLHTKGLKPPHYLYHSEAYNQTQLKWQFAKDGVAEGFNPAILQHSYLREHALATQVADDGMLRVATDVSPASLEGFDKNMDPLFHCFYYTVFDLRNGKFQLTPRYTKFDSPNFTCANIASSLGLQPQDVIELRLLTVPFYKVADRLRSFWWLMPSPSKY